MKEQWSTSKEKLVSLEEGKNEEISSVKVAEKKRNYSQLVKWVKYVLYVELVLFLGWAFYAMRQAYKIQSMEIKVTDNLRELESQSLFHQKSMQDTNSASWNEFQESEDLISDIENFLLKVTVHSDGMTTTNQEIPTNNKIDIAFSSTQSPDSELTLNANGDKESVSQDFDASSGKNDLANVIEDALIPSMAITKSRQFGATTNDDEGSTFSSIDAVDDIAAVEAMEPSRSEEDQSESREDFVAWSFPFQWSIHGLGDLEETDINSSNYEPSNEDTQKKIEDDREASEEPEQHNLLSLILQDSIRQVDTLEEKSSENVELEETAVTEISADELNIDSFEVSRQIPSTFDSRSDATVESTGSFVDLGTGWWPRVNINTDYESSTEESVEAEMQEKGTDRKTSSESALEDGVIEEKTNGLMQYKCTNKILHGFLTIQCIAERRSTFDQDETSKDASRLEGSHISIRWFDPDYFDRIAGDKKPLLITTEHFWKKVDSENSGTTEDDRSVFMGSHEQDATFHFDAGVPGSTEVIEESRSDSDKFRHLEEGDYGVELVTAYVDEDETPREKENESENVDSTRIHHFSESPSSKEFDEALETEDMLTSDSALYTSTIRKIMDGDAFADEDLNDYYKQLRLRIFSGVHHALVNDGYPSADYGDEGYPSSDYEEVAHLSPDEELLGSFVFRKRRSIDNSPNAKGEAPNALVNHAKPATILREAIHRKEVTLAKDIEEFDALERQRLQQNLNEFFRKMEMLTTHIDNLEDHYIRHNELNDDYVSKEFTDVSRER